MLSGKEMGGILLVAGTTIGAGMLAMPVSTGLMGFFPSVVLFFLYWIFMLVAAWLFLEVNLWMGGENVNLLSMAEATLGSVGRWVGWIFYLFLLYALTTAYMAGSAPLFQILFEKIGFPSIPEWINLLPLAVVFGGFVFKGAHSVDLINRILMMGFALTFFILVGGLIPYGEVSKLTHTVPFCASAAVSLLATAFGFHIVIPTLCRYLHRDVHSLRKVLFIGSIIPLFVYILWEGVVLSVLSLDEIERGYIQGISSITLITNQVHATWIVPVAEVFSFFAIVTSFLGVSLSLRDFLVDGLSIKKDWKGNALLYLLTFGPSFVFALSHPRAFFVALDYAGAFGVIVLLAILPTCMVYWGRKKYPSPLFKTPGGSATLAAMIVVSVLIIGIEISRQMGVCL